MVSDGDSERCSIRRRYDASVAVAPPGIIRQRRIAPVTCSYESQAVEPSERKELEKKARGPLAGRIRTALLESNHGRGKVSELARSLGVTPNTVYRMRKGEFAPSLFTLASIAKFTGKPMEWFVEDFQHPTGAVFREWRRSRPGADPAHVKQLETVDESGASLGFFDVALAALAAGSTLEAAVSAAKAAMQGA
jgi:transcriptional regulator with XRE-family HTH domain